MNPNWENPKRTNIKNTNTLCLLKHEKLAIVFGSWTPRKSKMPRVSIKSFILSAWKWCCEKLVQNYQFETSYFINSCGFKRMQNSCLFSQIERQFNFFFQASECTRTRTLSNENRLNSRFDLAFYKRALFYCLHVRRWGESTFIQFRNTCSKSILFPNCENWHITIKVNPISTDWYQVGKCAEKKNVFSSLIVYQSLAPEGNDRR